MGQKQAGHQGLPFGFDYATDKALSQAAPGPPHHFKPRHVAKRPFQGGLYLCKTQLDPANSRS